MVKPVSIAIQTAESFLQARSITLPSQANYTGRRALSDLKAAAQMADEDENGHNVHRRLTFARRGVAARYPGTIGTNTASVCLPWRQAADTVYSLIRSRYGKTIARHVIMRGRPINLERLNQVYINAPLIKERTERCWELIKYSIHEKFGTLDRAQEKMIDKLLECEVIELEEAENFLKNPAETFVKRFKSYTSKKYQYYPTIIEKISQRFAFHGDDLPQILKTFSFMEQSCNAEYLLRRAKSEYHHSVYKIFEILIDYDSTEVKGRLCLPNRSFDILLMFIKECETLSPDGFDIRAHQIETLLALSSSGDREFEKVADASKPSIHR